MASLLNWAKKAVDTTYHGINPFDNGQGWTTQAPQQNPQQSSGGRGLASKLFDQFNMFDSGRSFKNPNPTNNRSALGQLTHSGLTNTVGNLVAKPFVINPASNLIETGRMIAADATNNVAAQNASKAREWQNIKDSIPGFLAQQGFHAGQAGFDLGFKAPILDLKGNRPAADAARTAGLQAFNKTLPGQATSPLQYGIANLGKASPQKQAEVGLNPNATGAQKYFADPLMGTLGTIGLAKGAMALAGTKTPLPRVPQNIAIKEAVAQTAKPQTKVASPQLALPAPSGTVQGPGFTMTAKPNPAVVQLGKQIASIDGQLNQVRAGQSIKTPSEVRTLVQQKNDLVKQAQNPETVPQPLAVPTLKPVKAGTPEANARLNTIQQAQQGITRSPLDTLPSKTPDLGLPKVPTYSGAPKAPGAVDRAWQTVNGVISQHGTGGQEIARRNSEARNQSEIGQQAFIDKIPSVSKLSKNDFTTFAQSLDLLSKGEKVNVKPHIQQAIGEYNKAIPGIRDRAVKAGLNVGDLGPNYFPRQYKNFDKNMGKLADQMVKNGKATDLGDAMGKLQFMKNEYQKPFGNLEKTRQFDLPGHEQIHGALTNYIGRSFDRITKAEQFGPKNETLNQLRARVQQEGYDASPGSTLDKYIKTALGDVNRDTPGNKISGNIRKFNALRSLSTAQISNATQLPTNTGTIAGVGRTIKGAYKTAVSSKERTAARETGVILEHSISNLAKQGLGTSGALTRNIASPFFRQVEKFNRMATAVVGKDYGNKLAKQGDVKQLREKFGVTGDIGKQLTRDQEIQVSRKLVELAQFKVDPMDLPAWVDTPTGKLIAQFRTFGYKQTDFMYNQVLREAVKGNFLPLSRFLAVGVPAGAASLAVKGAIKGSQYTSPDESNASKAAKAIAAVGGFGLPGSEGQNIYKSNQYGNTPGALAGVVGGPTASLLTETATNIGDKGLAKGNWTPLAKEGVRNIPVVGPSIANRAFPKSATPQPSTKPDATPAEKNAQAKVEMKALGTNAGNNYSIQQLSNGRYAYTLEGDTTVHEAKNLKDANKAVAKDAFGNSDSNIKVIGEQVLRKDASGNVTTTTKTKYDYQIGTAELTHYKRTEDLAGWTSTAQKQLDSIDKQLKDPNIDSLDAITLQNQADAIISDAQKYQSYGGFTKPKTGRVGGTGSRGGRPKGATSFSAAGFKTAGSRASSPKGISVKKLAQPKFSTKTRKLSVSKLPKFK